MKLNKNFDQVYILVPNERACVIIIGVLIQMKENIKNTNLRIGTMDNHDFIGNLDDFLQSNLRSTKYASNSLLYAPFAYEATQLKKRRLNVTLDL
jgi:hypothetical protein